MFVDRIVFILRGSSCVVNVVQRAMLSNAAAAAAATNANATITKLEEMNESKKTRHENNIDFDMNNVLEKLNQMPVKINTNLLDKETLRRIDLTSTEFLADLVSLILLEL